MLRDKRLTRVEVAKRLRIDVSTLDKWFPGADFEHYRGIPLGLGLAQAVEAWPRDLRARDLRRPWRVGHQCTFRSLEAYAGRRGSVDLGQRRAE